MAVYSLIRVEGLNSVCVKSLKFGDLRCILFVLLRDCRSAAPIPKLYILMSIPTFFVVGDYRRMV